MELGKSVVYQESNSGEAKHLMSNINELWFPVATVTHEYIKNCAFYSETRVDVKESVRGQDIFIIQTIPR